MCIVVNACHHQPPRCNVVIECPSHVIEWPRIDDCCVNFSDQPKPVVFHQHVARGPAAPNRPAAQQVRDLSVAICKHAPRFTRYGKYDVSDVTVADITTGDPFMDEYTLVMGNVADLAKVCCYRPHSSAPLRVPSVQRTSPWRKTGQCARRSTPRCGASLPLHSCKCVANACTPSRAKATLRDDVTQRLQKTVNKPRGVAAEIVQDRTRKIAAALAAIDGIPDGVSMLRKPLPVCGTQDSVTTIRPPFSHRWTRLRRLGPNPRLRWWKSVWRLALTTASSRSFSINTVSQRWHSPR